MYFHIPYYLETVCNSRKKRGVIFERFTSEASAGEEVGGVCLRGGGRRGGVVYWEGRTLANFKGELRIL